MSPWLASLALALIAAIGFAVATSVYVALAWPWLRERLAPMPPSLRARVAWLAAIAPGALPVLLVTACFVPGLLAAAGLADDHCTQHPEHAHLCLMHASLPLTHAGIGLLACAAVLLATAIVPEIVNLVRIRHWLARLPREASPFGRDLEVVASRTPFAFAAGLLRPRIHVAARLVETLPAAQLAAVIEHERAHARRRDPLLRLAARVLSRAHIPGVRRALLDELALASEQACDAEAGRRVGDRLAVAEAILAIERLFADVVPVPAGLAGFDGDSVAERVRALLAVEPPAPPRRAQRIAAALACVSGLACVGPLHHLTEHLLALASRLF